MKPIRSKYGFKKWATGYWGKDWYSHKDLFKSYGVDDLCENFPEYESEIMANWHRQNNKYPLVFDNSMFSYEKVYNRAKDEIEYLKNSPTRKKDRTDENIEAMTIQGHYAELYLIEKCGFTDCSLKYHDLYDTDGVITEVKAGTKKYCDDQFERIKKSSWNTSKRMIAYYHDNGNYYLYFDKEIK